MDQTEKKRRKEQLVVGKMIELYCRKKHSGGGKGHLCPACQKLLSYASDRSEHCPFMAQKTFCSNCKVHCYKPEMREQIREVMRYAGPRMLLHHPVLAVWHVLCSRKEKKRK